MSQGSEPREYFLTINDDGSPTHICLFERYGDNKQLELVPKSAFDNLAAKLAEAEVGHAEAIKVLSRCVDIETGRADAAIEQAERMYAYTANAEGILKRAGVDENHPLSGVLSYLKKALAEYAKWKGEGR